MAWGEGDEERIIARDIGELKETAKYISYQQTFNEPIDNRTSGGPSDGGAGLLIGLVLFAPLIVVLHLLGVDEGGGIFAGIISLLYGIILFLVGVYLWSFKNIFTLLGIGLPVTVFILAILFAIFSNIFEWISWKFRRKHKKNVNNIRKVKPVNQVNQVNQTIQIRCISCNNLNRENAVFCTKCGARLRK